MYQSFVPQQNVQYLGQRGNSVTRIPSEQRPQQQFRVHSVSQNQSGELKTAQSPPKKIQINTDQSNKTTYPSIDKKILQDKVMKIIQLEKELNRERIEFSAQKRDYETKLHQQEVYIQGLLGQIEQLTVQLYETAPSKGDPFKNVQVQSPVRTSIYERIGGAHALSLAVDRFYDKVMRDGRVKQVFAKTNMSQQRQMQKDFLTTVLGGPKIYKGKDMKNAHSHLKITNEQFDAITELLVGTLIELGVKKQEINEIALLVEPLRNEIVTQTPQKSIFERIGGKEAVELAVNKFYDKVLKDSRVKDFFTKTDMNKQRQAQKEFITTVLGGPSIYHGKNMKDAHAHLKTQNVHFDVICELLLQTLKELGVQHQEITEISDLLSALRNDCVTVGSQSSQSASNCIPTIYEGIGGKTAIDLAVDRFYDKVLKDDRVKHFFKNTDMKNQRQQQKDFLTTVLGGPNTYKGKNMKDAHKHLKLTDTDFNVIVELIVSTLKELGVKQEWIQKIEEILETTRSDCVTVKKQSIYERLGGQDAIDLAVETFYDKVLIDRRVKNFFQNTDMKNQRQQQKNFLTTVLGGPNIYKGKNMRDAHKHLKLTDKEFNVIVELLVSTLQELGVGSDLINEIGVIVESVRKETLNK